MATIKDVAKQAGVSFKTVSRVINNHPNVSDAVRQKVMRAIEDLDYRPNQVARNMRTKKTSYIGLITDQIVTTPFSGEIIRGAQEAAWQNGKILLNVNTERQPDVEQAAVDMMLEQQVEGIIFGAMFHSRVTPPANITEVPTVLVDCFAEDMTIPSVVPDEYLGGYTATAYLIGRGHERIAIINGKEGFPATEGRLAGYIQALQDHKMDVDENFIRYGGWWQEDGYKTTLDLMKLSFPPTAIFCGNDRIAMGVYDALREQGKRIPSDIAVLGFDNMEVIAAHMQPGLTTMALPYYDMGRWAVEQLAINGNRNGAIPKQTKLPCRLIKRGSA